MSLKINLIWVQSANGVIATGYEQPFFFKQDLKRFEELTKNSVVVMGRKTWEAIGETPLPDRLNIIMSKHGFQFSYTDLSIEELMDCAVVRSQYELFQMCENEGIEEIFIIGGAKIYTQFVDMAHTLYRTTCNFAICRSDAVYFTPNLSQFELIDSYQVTDVDKKSKRETTLTFETFERVVI